MSVVRRGDLVVSVGTGGRSPALAAHLRRWLEDELAGYDTLLDLLASARAELRAAGRPTAEADWQRAFDAGIVEMVREGRIEDAEELLRTCL
jgi:siroheme synthase (precorrin-2 oxidase/ferrochelatase)